MTEKDREQKEIITLCGELSTASAGYKNRVVFKATLNILATTIVNGCDTLQEAEAATEETTRALIRAVRNYWQAAHPS